jgi:hypothetical protein
MMIKVFPKIVIVLLFIEFPSVQQKARAHLTRSLCRLGLLQMYATQPSLCLPRRCLCTRSAGCTTRGLLRVSLPFLSHVFIVSSIMRLVHAGVGHVAGVVRWSRSSMCSGSSVEGLANVTFVIGLPCTCD